MAALVLGAYRRRSKIKIMKVIIGKDVDAAHGVEKEIFDTIDAISEGKSFYHPNYFVYPDGSHQYRYECKRGLILELGSTRGAQPRSVNLVGISDDTAVLILWKADNSIDGGGASEENDALEIMQKSQASGAVVENICDWQNLLKNP